MSSEKTVYIAFFNRTSKRESCNLTVCMCCQYSSIVCTNWFLGTRDVCMCKWNQSAQKEPATSILCIINSFSAISKPTIYDGNLYHARWLASFMGDVSFFFLLYPLSTQNFVNMWLISSMLHIAHSPFLRNRIWPQIFPRILNACN